jgi:hypothetical protein
MRIGEVILIVFRMEAHRVTSANLQIADEQLLSEQYCESRKLTNEGDSD